MGCKGSKDAAGDDKKIDYTFETTGFVKFDQLFQNASTILESAEKIRAGLEDSKEEGAEIAGTDQLKDPKYVETLRVLLWSISAQGKGKILDVGTQVTEEKPYLTVEANLLNEESRKLYNTFKEYVNTVVDSPEDLKTSITKLQELVEMIPDATKDAKAEIESSSMNVKEKVDATIKIKKNSEKLPKQLEKCKRLSEVLKEAGTDLKQTVPELKGLVGSADEVGSKANTENLFKPKEIFDKFHTGVKKVEGKAKTQSKPAEKKEEKVAEKKEEKVAEKKEEKPVADKKDEPVVTEKKDEPVVTEKKVDQSPEKKVETQSPEKVEGKAGTHVQTTTDHKPEDKVDSDVNAEERPEGEQHKIEAPVTHSHTHTEHKPEQKVEVTHQA